MVKPCAVMGIFSIKLISAAALLAAPAYVSLALVHSLTAKPAQKARAKVWLVYKKALKVFKIIL